MRRNTPNKRGGVTKSISFNFWSESRSSVKRTFRKVAERASHAQIDAAAPTCSRSVSSKSPPKVSVFMKLVRCGYVSQSRCRCKAACTNPYEGQAWLSAAPTFRWAFYDHPDACL